MKTIVAKCKLAGLVVLLVIILATAVQAAVCPTIQTIVASELETYLDAPVSEVLHVHKVVAVGDLMREALAKRPEVLPIIIDVISRPEYAQYFEEIAILDEGLAADVLNNGYVESFMLSDEYVEEFKEGKRQLPANIFRAYLGRLQEVRSVEQPRLLSAQEESLFLDTLRVLRKQANVAAIGGTLDAQSIPQLKDTAEMLFLLLAKIERQTEHPALSVLDTTSSEEYSPALSAYAERLDRIAQLHVEFIDLVGGIVERSLNAMQDVPLEGAVIENARATVELSDLLNYLTTSLYWDNHPRLGLVLAEHFPQIQDLNVEIRSELWPKALALKNRLPKEAPKEVKKEAPSVRMRANMPEELATFESFERADRFVAAEHPKESEERMRVLVTALVNALGVQSTNPQLAQAVFDSLGVSREQNEQFFAALDQLDYMRQQAAYARTRMLVLRKELQRLRALPSLAVGEQSELERLRAELEYLESIGIEEQGEGLLREARRKVEAQIEIELPSLLNRVWQIERSEAEPQTYSGLLYQPFDEAKIQGGDHLDGARDANGVDVVVAIDYSGHGPAAAAIKAMVDVYSKNKQAVINGKTVSLYDARVLGRDGLKAYADGVNDFIAELFLNQKFAGGVMMRYDPTARTIDALLGGEQIVIVGADGSLRSILPDEKKGDIRFGAQNVLAKGTGEMTKRAEYYRETLQPGERAYVLTDGFFEAERDVSAFEADIESTIRAEINAPDVVDAFTKGDKVAAGDLLSRRITRFLASLELPFSHRKIDEIIRKTLNNPEYATIEQQSIYLPIFLQGELEQASGLVEDFLIENRALSPVDVFEKLKVYLVENGFKINDDLTMWTSDPVGVRSQAIEQSTKLGERSSVALLRTENDCSFCSVLLNDLLTALRKGNEDTARKIYANLLDNEHLATEGEKSQLAVLRQVFADYDRALQLVQAYHAKEGEQKTAQQTNRALTSGGLFGFEWREGGVVFSGDLSQIQALPSMSEPDACGVCGELVSKLEFAIIAAKQFDLRELGDERYTYLSPINGFTVQLLSEAKKAGSISQEVYDRVRKAIDALENLNTYSQDLSAARQNLDTVLGYAKPRAVAAQVQAEVAPVTAVPQKIEVEVPQSLEEFSKQTIYANREDIPVSQVVADTLSLAKIPSGQFAKLTDEDLLALVLERAKTLGLSQEEQDEFAKRFLGEQQVEYRDPETKSWGSIVGGLKNYIEWQTQDIPAFAQQVANEYPDYFKVSLLRDALYMGLADAMIDGLQGGEGSTMLLVSRDTLGGARSVVEDYYLRQVKSDTFEGARAELLELIKVAMADKTAPIGSDNKLVQNAVDHMFVRMRNAGIFEQEKILFTDTCCRGTIPVWLAAVIDYYQTYDGDDVRSAERKIAVSNVQDVRMKMMDSDRLPTSGAGFKETKARVEGLSKPFDYFTTRGADQVFRMRTSGSNIAGDEAVLGIKNFYGPNAELLLFYAQQLVTARAMAQQLEARSQGQEQHDQTSRSVDAQEVAAEAPFKEKLVEYLDQPESGPNSEPFETKARSVKALLLRAATSGPQRVIVALDVLTTPQYAKYLDAAADASLITTLTELPGISDYLSNPQRTVPQNIIDMMEEEAFEFEPPLPVTPQILQEYLVPELFEEPDVLPAGLSVAQGVQLIERYVVQLEEAAQRGDVVLPVMSIELREQMENAPIVARIRMYEALLAAEKNNQYHERSRAMLSQAASVQEDSLHRLTNQADVPFSSIKELYSLPAELVALIDAAVLEQKPFAKGVQGETYRIEYVPKEDVVLGTTVLKAGVPYVFAFKAKKRDLMAPRFDDEYEAVIHEYLSRATKLSQVKGPRIPQFLGMHTVVVPGAKMVGTLQSFVEGEVLEKKVRAPGLLLQSYVNPFYPLASTTLEEILVIAQTMRKAGIAHTDLNNYENIIVDKDGHVVVIDFGYATKIPSTTQLGTHSRDLEIVLQPDRARLWNKDRVMLDRVREQLAKQRAKELGISRAQAKELVDSAVDEKASELALLVTRDPQGLPFQKAASTEQIKERFVENINRFIASQQYHRAVEAARAFEQSFGPALEGLNPQNQLVLASELRERKRALKKINELASKAVRSINDEQGCASPCAELVEAAVRINQIVEQRGRTRPEMDKIMDKLREQVQRSIDEGEPQEVWQKAQYQIEQYSVLTGKTKGCASCADILDKLSVAIFAARYAQPDERGSYVQEINRLSVQLRSAIQDTDLVRGDIVEKMKTLSADIEKIQPVSPFIEAKKNIDAAVRQSESEGSARVLVAEQQEKPSVQIQVEEVTPDETLDEFSRSAKYADVETIPVAEVVEDVLTFGRMYHDKFASLNDEDIRTLVLERAKAVGMSDNERAELQKRFLGEMDVVYEDAEEKRGDAIVGGLKSYIEWQISDIPEFATKVAEQYPDYFVVSLLRDALYMGLADSIVQEAQGGKGNTMLLISRDTLGEPRVVVEDYYLRRVRADTFDEARSQLLDLVRQAMSVQNPPIGSGERYAQFAVNHIVNVLVKSGVLNQKKLLFTDTCCRGTIPVWIAAVIDYYKEQGDERFKNVESVEVLMMDSDRLVDGGAGFKETKTKVEGLSKPFDFMSTAVGQVFRIRESGANIAGDESVLAIRNLYGPKAELVLFYAQQLLTARQTAQHLDKMKESAVSESQQEQVEVGG